MYRFLLLILFTSFFSYSSFAQEEKFSFRENCYTKLGIGYSFITGATTSIQRTDNSLNSYTLSAFPFSYGKGFAIQYGLIGFFTKYLGAELILSNFIGTKIKSTNYYMDDSGSETITVTQQIGQKSNLFRVNPSFIIQAPSGKVVPYAKMGLIFGWGKAIRSIDENAIIKKAPDYKGEFEWTFKGGKTLGFTSAMGVMIKGKDNVIGFFIEASHIGMVGTFEKASATKYTVNGNNYLLQLNVAEREIIFEEQTVVSSSSGNPNQPTRQLKEKNPYSSFGFNVGIMLNLANYF